MFSWWFTILVLGICCMPLTMLVFRRFDDRGWLFSKSIGIMLVGWLMFVLSSAHIMKFAQSMCIVLIIIVLALNVLLFIFGKQKELLKGADFKLIIIEEIAFLALFLIWVYIIGFKPEAYGTEKFMDYAFITSMMRTTYLPPVDPWFSGEAINYYYGGQYLTAFIIKMSGVTAGEGYTLMRAAIASFSFVLPFSVVYQLLRSRFAKRTKATPAVGGALGGLAVAYCGNFQYVIWGIIKPFVAKMYGEEYSYWFPDATRFIGYNPDMPDKTIHEFPAYSTVLGDLHAHYINIVFVVIVVAAAVAYALRLHEEMTKANVKSAAGFSGKKQKGGKAGKAGKTANASAAAANASGKAGKAANGQAAASTAAADAANASAMAEAAANASAGAGEKMSFGAFVKKWLPIVLCPEIVLIGFCTGIFRWTNFWDFPIYFVVGGAVVFFMNLRRYWGPGKKAADSDKDGEKRGPLTFILVMAAQAIAAFVIGTIAALPFTLGFDQISSEILPTHSHTMFYQLMILWGLPLAVTLVLAIKLFLEWRLAKKAGAVAEEEKKGAVAEEKKKRLPFRMDPMDLVVLLLGLCAAGLVLLPEVIYVVDIYTGDYYRANTMFKLTYQAFILFGMVMGYSLVRVFMTSKKVFRIICGVLAACLLLTSGYIITSCKSWFGADLSPEKRVHTDASVYVSQSFKEDFDAICWINSNIFGQPVMVEAAGDSYTGYERVSVSTGLPTILGWYVHEWLWRSGTDKLNVRKDAINTLYTSTNAADVQRVIDTYNVSYIYVGKYEHEQYPNINDAFLKSMGTVVYEDANTYIVKVTPSGSANENAVQTTNAAAE